MLQKIRLALVKKAMRVVVYSFSSDIHSLMLSVFCLYLSVKHLISWYNHVPRLKNIYSIPGHEIVPNTGANVTKFFPLANKS